MTPSLEGKGTVRSDLIKQISKAPSNRYLAKSSVRRSTKKSSELQLINDPRKTINRRATVIEIGSQPNLIPCPPSYKSSTHSILTTIPLHYFSSPVPSYTSTGGTPSNSVRFSDSDSDISPGESHLHLPKCSSKSILKLCKHSVDVPSLFDGNSIIAASEAIECILYDFAGGVKNFRCPDEHDVSTSDENPLLFTRHKMNNPFINQLYRVDGIRARPEGIPFDYQRAKEKAKSTRSLVLLHADLIECIKNFGLPSSLDLIENPEGILVLPNTVKNRPFINRLNELERFRDELMKIPTHENEKLNNKHRDISTTLGQTIQGMKKIQMELYELSRRAYQ
ncbi:hypothetical protein OPQ81_002660 [Rhizoctonia solani]|nr:hypothetical protein OPQ81_002660 [Rhizoctonia solani]